MTQKPKRNRWALLIGPLILMAIVFLPKYIKQVLNPPQKVLKQDYMNHVFLLQHDYVYKASLEMDGGTASVYLVKNSNNQFDAWEAGATANRMHAAALMTDSSGVCITSRYATEPWKNAADEKWIKKLLAEQTGLPEDKIRVSGITIRLTIQSLTQLAGGNAKELAAVVYDSKEDGEELRYIGLKDPGSPLPVKKLPFDILYINNMEPGKNLYALTWPAIDLTAGLPFQPEVIKIRSAGYDMMYTTFENTGLWLPEGAPVFDKDLNLLGVYTNVNNRMQSNYISNLLRHGSNSMPGYMQETINKSLQEQVNAIPDTIPEQLKFTIDQSELNDPSFPFGKSKEWQFLYEVTNTIYEVAGSDVSNYDMHRTSPDYDFANERSRIRVKAEGGNVSVSVILLKRNSSGNYQEEKRYDLRKEGTEEYDLGYLTGNYYMGVLYNSTQTKLRVAWEKRIQ